MRYNPMLVIDGAALVGTLASVVEEHKRADSGFDSADGGLDSHTLTDMAHLAYEIQGTC